ncbi:MAG: DUF559 domain-containing protein [Nocardiaceae bacterium]|nr:DUF559 domain-containing protein [Nocardiaceae bacterium]
MDQRQFAELLAIQDGVISMKQARECGLSDDAIQWRLDAGLWHSLTRGVYLVAGHPRSHRTRLRAAVMGAGRDAVAHGASAAWWHGLRATAPSRPTITIPSKRWIDRTGIDVRRRNLNFCDIEQVLGLSVTKVPLTVLETGDSLLMDRALQTQVTLEDLQETHERNLRYAGSAKAAELLTVAATGGRSEAERLFHRIIGPLVGWRAQVPIGPYQVDVAFEAARLIIEVDGWRWHKDAARNSDDLRRQNYLMNLGWRVLRYDWHRLNNEPEAVLAEVEEAAKMQNAPR